MAVSFKSSPHAAAAGQVMAEQVTEETTTKTVGGVSELPEIHTETTGVSVPVQHEIIEVGMNFKMPLADFVIIGWDIRRSIPCAPDDADEVYADTFKWVEDRINVLVSEQQKALQQETNKNSE